MTVGDTAATRVRTAVVFAVLVAIPLTASLVLGRRPPDLSGVFAR
jgi:hypothetical protein